MSERAALTEIGIVIRRWSSVRVRERIAKPEINLQRGEEKRRGVTSSRGSQVEENPRFGGLSEFGEK